MQKKVRVALIGYGHLGRWHAQKAHELEQSQLVAIVDASKETLQKAQEIYPDVKVTSDFLEIQDFVDAVIIAAPTSIHVDLIKICLQHNKHIFCEKPLVSNLKEVKLVEQMLSSDLVFQVGHSERCHQVWSELSNFQSLIDSPTIIKTHRQASFKGRATDVDVVQDLMIHDIDLILWLFQRKVRSVKAYGEKIRTNYWDHVEADLYLEGDIKASLSVGRNYVYEQRDLEVMGRDGVLKVDLFKNLYHYAAKGEEESGNFVSTHSYQKRDHLKDEQAAFYRSILQGDDVFVDFEQGRKAVEIVDAVLESLAEKKEVVLK